MKEGGGQLETAASAAAASHGFRAAGLAAHGHAAPPHTALMTPLEPHADLIFTPNY